jgi:5-deoxy-glucuronate isomerase
MIDRRAIPSAAPSNDLPPERLHLRPGPGGRTATDPDGAGWRYLSFAAFPVPASGRDVSVAAGVESAVVVLDGGGLRVEPDGSAALELPGRRTVFDGLPWAVYLPAGTSCRLLPMPADVDSPVRVALAQAPVTGAEAEADVSRRPIAIGPDDVRVEVRGAGTATRQVDHIIMPSFPAARLEVVEVYTPAGNWSSWPPHKHDVDDMPREAVLEEVYHYRFRPHDGWGIQRLYRTDGSRNAIWVVRDGDLVIVTDGYHPFVAAHGYDAYYLNALAGDRRTMACSDDPASAWTRAAWADLEPDPRVPLVPPSPHAR